MDKVQDERFNHTSLSPGIWLCCLNLPKALVQARTTRNEVGTAFFRSKTYALPGVQACVVENSETLLLLSFGHDSCAGAQWGLQLGAADVCGTVEGKVLSCRSVN